LSEVLAKIVKKVLDVVLVLVSLNGFLALVALIEHALVRIVCSLVTEVNESSGLVEINLLHHVTHQCVKGIKVIGQNGETNY